MITIFLITVDVGTTNLKITLLDSDFQILETTSYQYKNVISTDDNYLLDTNEIYDSINRIVSGYRLRYELTNYEVSLTTAMHTIQLMDTDYNLIGNLYTWNDKTGSMYIDSQNINFNELYLRTGTPIHPMNPFYKLLEISKTMDLTEIRIGSIKDVIAHKLTGNWVIDESNASSSGLYNLRTNQWDQEILEFLNLRVNQLPTISSVNQKFLILNSNNSLVIGTSDGVSASYLFHEYRDAAIISIGTSHAVRMLVNHVILDKEIMNFCYKIGPDEFLTGLPSNNGGNVFEWILELFNQNWEELRGILQSKLDIKAIFMPFVFGERSPMWNELAKPNISFLTHDISQDELIYSMVSGVLFNIRYNFELLETIKPAGPIFLTGGVSNSPEICQMLADILERVINVTELENSETIGTISLLYNKTPEFNIVKYHPKEDYGVFYNLYKEKVREQLGGN